MRWIESLGVFDHTGLSVSLLLIALCGLGAVTCFFACYFSEVYTLAPGWGPIRKYDSAGNEELRINQLLVHEHVAKLEAARLEAKVDVRQQPKVYGSIGPCTWGECEYPVQPSETMWSPQYGWVNVRPNFAATQYMRWQSGIWARDESFAMQADGLHSADDGRDLGEDETGKNIQQRMVFPPKCT